MAINTEASGIIAYGRALAQTAWENGLLSDDDHAREVLNLDVMDQSFQAQARNDDDVRQLKSGTSENARQWAALILAYSSLSMLVTINLFPPQTNAQERSAAIVEWLAAQDDIILAALFILGAVVSYSGIRLYTFFNYTYRHENIARWIYRPRKRWLYIGGSIVLIIGIQRLIF